MTNLRFADDIVLFAESGEELRSMILDISKISEEVGLTLNPRKTKLMTNG